MKTVIDRGDAPLSAYLLKILTILVRKSAGEIRIDAMDMMDDLGGEGLSKRFDRDAKQLVLTFVPTGSEIYFNKSEESQWPNVASLSPAKPRSSQVHPLQSSMQMEDLLSGRETMDQQSMDQQSQPRRSSQMTDERLADLEDQMRKERAAQVLANFPGTPVTAPAREPQPRRGNSAQPAYYRI